MKVTGGKRIASKLAAPVKQVRRAILRALDARVRLPGEGTPAPRLPYAAAKRFGRGAT